MCIRDSAGGHGARLCAHCPRQGIGKPVGDPASRIEERLHSCLLYTSDAADERSSVDLGGRRIIKKKTHSDIDYQPLRT